jgi:hypothetical protein
MPFSERVSHMKTFSSEYFVKNFPVRASCEGYRPDKNPATLFDVNEDVE